MLLLLLLCAVVVGGSNGGCREVEVTERIWVVVRMVLVEKESVCLLMMCMCVPGKHHLCSSV